MRIEIEINSETLKDLIARAIGEKINGTVSATDVRILVKSKQNYKSEWEDAAFKATYSKDDKL